MTIRTDFIICQRTAFPEKQVGLLRLANEYANLVNELTLKRQKFDNEVLRLSREGQSIRLSFEDEAAAAEIQGLENERQKLERKPELAGLKRELEALNNPPPPPPREPTRAEIAAQKAAELDKKISDIIERIAKIENFSVASEEDKQRQINRLRNKLFDLEEERNDLL